MAKAIGEYEAHFRSNLVERYFSRRRRMAKILTEVSTNGSGAIHVVSVKEVIDLTLA